MPAIGKYNCLRGILIFALSCSVRAQTNSQVTGEILDPSSAPVAKVSVTLSSPDRALQMETGADGQFLFFNVPSATYELEASAQGFVKQTRAIEVPSRDSAALTIVLKLGSMPDMNYCGPYASITYESAQVRPRRLAGTIRDFYSQKPVSRARVFLLEGGQKRPLLTGTSDKRGKYQFNDPPAGRYTLRISKEGYLNTDRPDFLLPRENGARVDFTLLERGHIVVCQ